MKIEFKGFVPHKKGEKTFLPENVRIEKSSAVSFGIMCSKYDFIDDHTKDNMLTLHLQEGYTDDYVKLREIRSNSEYDGSGIGRLAIKKAFDIALKLGKSLVIDCVCSNALFKALKKLENEGYKIVENPEGVEFRQNLNEYRAKEHSWTFLVAKNDKETEAVLSDTTKKTFLKYFRRPVLDSYKDLTSYDEYKKGKYSSDTINNDLTSFELLLEALKATNKDFSEVIINSKAKVAEELQKAEERGVVEEGVDVMKYFNPSEGTLSVFASLEEKETVILHLKNELTALDEIPSFINTNKS